jgi:hypothetical protein
MGSSLQNQNELRIRANFGELSVSVGTQSFLTTFFDLCVAGAFRLNIHHTNRQGSLSYGQHLRKIASPANFGRK